MANATPHRFALCPQWDRNARVFGGGSRLAIKISHAPGMTRHSARREGRTP